MITAAEKVRDMSAKRKASVTRLWLGVFGDSDEFISDFLASTSSDGTDMTDSLTSYVTYTEDGEAASMLFRVPVTLAPCGKTPIKGGYIYAAATSPLYRGRGFFRTLMTLAEKDMSFTVLIPGKEELYAMYRSLGYDTELETDFPFECDSRLLGRYKPFDGDWQSLYREYLRCAPECVPLRSLSIFRLALSEYDIIRFENGGYAAVSSENENNCAIKVYEMYSPYRSFSDIIITSTKNEKPERKRFGMMKKLDGLVGDIRPELGLFLQ